jgi:hypothetical protein
MRIPARFLSLLAPRTPPASVNALTFNGAAMTFGGAPLTFVS